MNYRDNFFILTGASGSGKSTLIEALRALGHHCVDEVGREIVKHQRLTGGSATPWEDHRSFMTLLLAGYVRAFEAVAERARPVFFDRGIPECLDYASRFLDDAGRRPFVAAASTCRYNRLVFYTPPWRDIYTTDAKRRRSYDEGVEEEHLGQLASYRRQGYHLREVARGSVDERACFVLEQVSRWRASRS